LQKLTNSKFADAMGLLILLGSGAVLGWLVALVTGAEDRRAAWFRVILGAGTTAVSGALVSDVPLLQTLGAQALLVALAAGCAVLTLVSVMEPLVKR
tara:strand:- start:356 stop:646 length:291 start_codon:yes stop_codon:yes gene_type:complete